MDKIKKDVKVLIVSWSPIPTPKYQKIEGSGQRFWGLANGLKKNGIKDITIAIGGIYPLDVNEVDGIKLFNYDFNDEFAEKLNNYDTIISNYAIHGSKFIFENLPENAQFIIDAYGPAYIESLARDPKDLINTYTGNLAAVKEVFNEVIPRGDFILYANDAQEKFYTGILASLGSINQFSYKTNKLIRAPFGIDKPDPKAKYENPYEEYGSKKGDFTLLWFGGLYPWFDITKVLDTVKNLKKEKVKLVIVGGNNPQNQHPDFVKHYFNTVEYVNKNKLEDQITFVEWADFATRRKYYEYADAIISINNEGKENVYSWRTRVMDYVGSTTPLITNGGDPLSDELIEVGAAFKVDDKDPESIQKTISKIVKDRKLIAEASECMKKLQPKYYWENVTKELAEKIKLQEKPYSDERDFRLTNGIKEGDQPKEAPRSRRSIKRVAGHVVRKVKSDGVKKTTIVIGAKIRRRFEHEVKKRFDNPAVQKSSKIYIIANQLNNTGAPFVIIDVVEQLLVKNPELARKIHFIAFTPVESENVKRLRKMGVFVDIYTNRELPLQFNQGDLVILNSFAISGTTLGSVIRDVNDGKIEKVFWYGHEATPELFISKENQKIFNKFLTEDKAKVYAVSEKSTRDYAEFFGTEKNVEKMTFKFLFPEEKFKIRDEKEFERLDFVMTGSLMDMRKGQYPILYAFLGFYHNFYVKNPENYRDFSIKFIGAYEKGDSEFDAPYHVKNILKQFKDSGKLLGDKFKITETLSHEEAIEMISQANATVCYSMYETMGIFVYEGMATGHPIIRNDCAGAEEQIFDGENGIAVYSEDFGSLAEAIEKMINKKKTSNQELAKMSKKSNEIAKKATVAKYQIIDEIEKTVKNNIK